MIFFYSISLKYTTQAHNYKNQMFLGLKYMPAAAALHKRQKFHHGNVSIYNHRKDEEEPAEDPKPQFHWTSCLRKF